MEKISIKTASAENKGPPYPFHAIIVAAGSGRRAGAPLPKQYMEIDGLPVLRHTAQAFLACKNLQSLVIVIDSAHESLCARALDALPRLSVAFGGKTRKESVFNGLKALPPHHEDEIILIHDAARPFVTPALLERLTAALDDHDAATLATPVADTLRRSKNGLAGPVTPRDGLWAIQTPQAFRARAIMHAHRQADPAVIWTDDSSLASAAGYDVALVEGPRENFKITTADDLLLADKLMRGLKS